MFALISSVAMRLEFLSSSASSLVFSINSEIIPFTRSSLISVLRTTFPLKDMITARTEKRGCTQIWAKKFLFIMRSLGTVAADLSYFLLDFTPFLDVLFLNFLIQINLKCKNKFFSLNFILRWFDFLFLL